MHLIHTPMQTREEFLENSKVYLNSSHEGLPTNCFYYSFIKLSQTITSVTIILWKLVKKVLFFFYKIIAVRKFSVPIELW